MASASNSSSKIQENGNQASAVAYQTAPRRSPFIPTTLEIIILSIYPATLLLGSVYALLDPGARTAPYDAAGQSYFADTAPSYFAKKSNIFNQLFVKRGWAWITISFFYFLFTHPSHGPRSLTVTPRRLRGILRWGLITLWWIFITQWFFGPPIIDRGFILTGGRCEMAEESIRNKSGSAKEFVTAAACKISGGKWRGGHDISGHVFLLVMGSMFLLEEVLHVVLRHPWVKEERTIVMHDGAVKGADVEARQDPNSAADDLVLWDFGVKFAIGVAALSWFMLFMTSVYFHSAFERISGLIVALSAIIIVYVLPRGVPAFRSIIGMPGI
ncbi:inositol phospholipid synthesis and fat-storage-inducing TM-domain-containing protein [Xylogone sp. PMI_703]|nr:inositol phospholipid synthesis and fat-storage-inducing TM-domain-containing protein [Xylogone sp. PMI_703]